MEIMKYTVLLFYFSYYYRNILAGDIVKLKNGWNLARPCKDNDKISILVRDGELSKQDFKYSLSIQGIATESKQITLLRDNDNPNKKNNVEEEEFKLDPGQKSFFTELRGKNGKIPKFKSLTIDGINFCKEPDTGVILNLSEGSQSNVIEPLVNDGGTIRQPILIDGGGNDEGDSDDDYVIPAKTSQSHRANDEYCGVRKIMQVGLITNGYTSKPGDWPWHAALYKIDSGLGFQRYICGGTLISKTLVLTAGHCVTESSGTIVSEGLKVILGQFELYGGGENTQEKSVFDIIVHKDFNINTIENDIALIKLGTIVKYTNYVQPACLWRSEYYEKLPSKNNIIGTVAGWGYNSTKYLANELQQTKLPMVSYKTCIKSNIYFATALQDFNFCAGYANGTSVCNGDSGGGYHIFIPNDPNNPTSPGKWYVFGIVSKAVSKKDEPVCDPYQYVLFTRVEVFSDWIEKYLV